MMNFATSLNALLLAFLLIQCVHGADVNICSSDKSAENQVRISKTNATFFSSSINQIPQARMTCAWKITAPPGYDIKIHITVAQWSEDCDVEYARIYDGATSSDALLREFCKAKPKNVRSSVALFTSSENARIVLKTGNNPNDTLFGGVAWAVKRPTQVCTNNAVYNLASSSTIANFSSPYYDEGYPCNASCGWKIEAPAGKIVKLQFKDTRVHYLHPIMVYDGEDDKQEDLIKTLSLYTYKSTDPIYSYGRTLFVKFKSGPALLSSQFTGFLAYYSAVDAGATCSPSNSADVNSRITPSASSGKITSPGFPSVVPPVPITCIFRLRAPIGQVVKLDLETINVKFRIGRLYSYVVDLRVNTGMDVYEIRSFGLRNSISETLVSDGRRIDVEYKQTDEIKAGVRPIGFEAEYETTPLVTTGSCGANQSGTINLQGEAATFHSLNYPNSHPGNMNCMWNVTVTGGQVIELRIDTTLSPDCDKEYIQIYDGATKSSPLIKKLCQYQSSYNSPSIYSSSNHLLVEFIGKDPSKGLHATYVARMAVPKPYACAGKSKKELKGMSGKLASQGFPLRYGNDAYCRWYITAPFQHIVKITVTSLDLEPDPSCEKDALRLISDEEIGSTEMAKLCGKKNTPLSYKSAYNKVTVEFWSDATGRYPGFEASYTAEPDPSFGNCTRQFVDNLIPMSSPSGTIFTPRYPKYYPPNMKCSWVIKVPMGNKIRLSFQEFFLKSCFSSSIEIRDGADDSSKILRTLCDTSSNRVVVFSSGSSLLVHFKSGSLRFTNQGFTAQYETVTQLPLSISCSDEVQTHKLKTSPGSLASYEYPLKYENNVKCTWVISTSSSERFRIKFDFMDIEPSPGCSDDYVIIRDGGYSFSDSLGKFCGNTKPDTLTSSEDAIWVQFVSNGTGRYPGFKLSYETTFNVRTIVLISAFSIIGGLGLLFVIGWIIKCCCCSSGGNDDGFSDGAGMNMMETNKTSGD